MSKVAIVAEVVGDPWGGSEELWSQAAIQLAEEGLSVAASVHGWIPLHDRVRDLIDRGIKLWVRPAQYPIWKRIWRRGVSSHKIDWLFEIARFLQKEKPKIVVLSSGGPLPTIDLVELCCIKKIPFVTIGQANFEGEWFVDEVAERYRKALPNALRCYFVSKANLRLAEKQIGSDLFNAEVVRNPFNVNINSSPPWPADAEIRFACVGRLNPFPKGQDILLETLANQVWMDRPWRLTLYGDGPMKNGIERLVQRLDLGGRVRLGGYIPRVEDIWAENHVLVTPSRFEGLPLAIVEAMLCGRPVVATDVAGHSEIVQDGITGFLAESPTVPSIERALERLWERRADLRRMGEAAAKHIRNCVPSDPAKVFSQKIQCFLTTEETHPE
jgi:glycosyltransferase involved in cell wall biosynthesis